MYDKEVKKIRGNNRKKFGRPVEKICEQCGNESYIPKFIHQWRCRYCHWINGIDGMKESHPKQYDYIMRPEDQGGLNYKEVIDWINEHGNMNIKY